MTTQLQLIAGAAPPRPDNRSPAIIEAVARKLLPEVVQWLGKDHDGNDAHLVKELTEALDREWDWDGYRLTKALRDWECDREMVEIMDNASFYAHKAHDAELLAWIAEYDIKPAFAIGDCVSCADAEGNPAEVVGIDTKRATYTVHVPAMGHNRPDSGKCGTIGFVVPFEKVSGVA